VKQVLTSPPRSKARKKTGDPFWDNLKFYDGGPTDLAACQDDYLYGGRF